MKDFSNFLTTELINEVSDFADDAYKATLENLGNPVFDENVKNIAVQASTVIATKLLQRYHEWVSQED